MDRQLDQGLAEGSESGLQNGAQNANRPEDNEAALRFGLIVIGDEVLKGERADAHQAHFKARLLAQGHELAWYWLLPDDPDLLTAHLRFSMQGAAGGIFPVFVCGGIGATPDDHTRACAAAAAGRELVRHPEARALIEGRFGEAAYPHRIRMADLPAGCDLIPNPYNQIPGFSLSGHWFLPGFPQMAWPMAEWVLQGYGAGSPQREAALAVLGAPESALIPLMEDLGHRFPGLKPFSLPHLGPDPHVLLGVRGHRDPGPAIEAMRAGLKAAGLRFRET